MKEHEGPIGEEVARVRERLYCLPFGEAAFDETGTFREGAGTLMAADDSARSAYIDRYVDFFEGSLKGLRILVYQHSAVGRDVLAELLCCLAAHVTTCGRSETFVAIDTEAIDAEQLATIQNFADEYDNDGFDAVLSTDGDSDRPLVLGFDEGKVKFFPGDLLGMITARYLSADAVVVPISCNDGIDRGDLAAVLEPKTRIGSPHVIAGMAAARAKGRKTVCGWEANGGFLLGSDVGVLKALPTRDAMLPILAVLFAAQKKGCSLVELFETLPGRYSRSALLRNFPRENGRRIVELLTASDAAERLKGFFTFSAIDRIDYTDGVRILFTNGEVAHFRPSGNADEFRMYAVADTQERADSIVAAGIAEPDGIIRAMERAFLGA